MPRMMSEIPHMLVIISKEQQITCMMLETFVVACKFKQKSEPSRRRKQT
jgi:hypothetical protein